jgi:hypothetical protein
MISSLRQWRVTIRGKGHAEGGLSLYLFASRMQNALFGLLATIFALKRPDLALDLWVQRSPHNKGLPAAVRASDWLDITG